MLKKYFLDNVNSKRRNQGYRAPLPASICTSRRRNSGIVPFPLKNITVPAITLLRERKLSFGIITIVGDSRTEYLK